MNLIKSFGNIAVSFNDCGYLNATQIAKQFDKRINNYLRSEQTQQYIEALYQNLKTRNSAMDKNQLVIIQKGGNVHFSGTWLDPKFAVWCDEQIEHIISGSLKLEPAQPALPHGSIVLSAHNLQCIEGFVAHVPYMLAYYRATETAVRSLNHNLAYRAHDHFSDGYLHALNLASRLNLPHKTWRDVAFELNR